MREVVLLWKRRKGIPYRPRRFAPSRWTAMSVRFKRSSWWLVTKRGFGVTVWATVHDGLVNPFWFGLTWYGDLEMVKRRKAVQPAEAPAHLAPMESNIMAKCFPLVSHCAATKYEDGEVRKPGWFTIRTRGSAWEIEIKDPDTCSRLVVIQANLDDALALASVLLESEEAPWEPDQWLMKASQTSRKK